MYCGKCGAKLEDHEKKCHECGAPVRIRRPVEPAPANEVKDPVYFEKPGEDVDVESIVRIAHGEEPASFEEKKDRPGRKAGGRRISREEYLASLSPVEKVYRYLQSISHDREEQEDKRRMREHLDRAAKYYADAGEPETPVLRQAANPSAGPGPVKDVKKKADSAQAEKKARAQEQEKARQAREEEKARAQEEEKARQAREEEKARALEEEKARQAREEEMIRAQEQEKARATEKLVGDLLPVLDDFERTIDDAEKNGTDNLLGGVEAVYAKLVNTLTTDGVEVIDPAGEPFDALQHQAVATVPDTETYDETVAAVYQKGYKMGGKVLRPAMVTVTTGGPKRPAEDEGAEE